MESLNEKQKSIYEALVSFYGDKIEPKKDIIVSKIKNLPEIEYLTASDEWTLREIFNDYIYDTDLFTRCIIPPFSVLDTKNGKWLDRRRLLDEYLGSSLAGRQEGLAYGDLKTRREKLKEKGANMTSGFNRGLLGSSMRDTPSDVIVRSVNQIGNGTSQFDSVLCELLLKWFGLPNCQVYDSFAGGHVRGTMASLLGYEYTGIELSTEQVEANVKRAKELNLNVGWINDDSLNVDNYVEDNSMDLFFSCPPYGDLEKYTDDPRDLSNMGYDDFKTNYREIIRKGVKKLKDNRFAVFVVGDFRDSKGFYQGFVKDTIQAFEDAGMGLYNELILLNSIGSASMRASKMFTNRKMVKVHQNVLVFYKGDNTKIREIYGEIDSILPIKRIEQKGLF